MSFQFIKCNDNFKSCVVPILYDKKYQFIRGRRAGGGGIRGKNNKFWLKLNTVLMIINNANFKFDKDCTMNIHLFHCNTRHLSEHYIHCL